MIESPPAQSEDLQVGPGAHASPPRPSRPQQWVRVGLACLLLLAAYGALSLLDDPHGVLGADSGGKLATLQVMHERGTWDPDVGYWAAAADPTGSLHPLYYTNRVGDRWVQVTTLPMLELARPLYEIGGLRAVLLLPMLGSVLTALAARAFARRLGSRGWIAFWAVGLATPVAVYALDFWEHALGLGLVAWGLVLAYDVCVRRAGGRVALGAGLLFGAAASLRTEALVYVVVACAAIAVAAARRRAWRRGVASLVATGIGVLLALAVNQLVELATLGTGLRVGRTATAAAGTGSGVGDRVREALTTAVGTNGFYPGSEVVIGVVLVALIGAAAILLLDERHRSRTVGYACLVGVLVILGARLAAGMGYVPGVLTASPLAAAGLVAGWRTRASRWLLVVACAAAPLIWIAQYSGNMRPQWGGRYLLVSGALLAVVGVVAVAPRPRALVPLVALGLALTMWSVVNLSVRSHRIADGMALLVARHDAAVISTEAHLLREGGAFYEPSRHWLTATGPGALRRAMVVVGRAGDREVAVVATDPSTLPERLAGFERAGDAHLEIRPGEHLTVVTYRSVT